MSDNGYIDVEYDDVRQEIKGEESIRYTAVQVSDMLGIPVSKVRYYMQCFENILDLEYSNNMKRMTKVSVEKLKYIIRLKDEDGLTIKQIQEYCDKKAPFEGGKLKAPNNPLAVDVFVEKLILEMTNQLTEFKNSLLEEIKAGQVKSNEELKEQVSEMVHDIISEKVEDVNNNVNQVVGELKQTQEDTLTEIKEYKREVTKWATISLEEVKKWEQANRDREANKGIVNKIKNLFK